MTSQQENMTPFYAIDNMGNAHVAGHIQQPALPLPRPGTAPPFPMQNNYPAPPAPAARPNLLPQNGMPGIPMGCNCTTCLTSRQASGPFSALPRPLPNPQPSSNVNFNPQPPFLSNGGLQQPLGQPHVHQLPPSLPGSAFGNHHLINDTRLGHNQLQYDSLGLKPAPLIQLPQYVNQLPNGMNHMQPNMARSDSLDFFNQMPQQQPRMPVSVAPPNVMPPQALRNPMLDLGRPSATMVPYNPGLPRPMMGPPMNLPPAVGLPPMPAPALPAFAPPKPNDESELAKALGFLDISGDITPPANTMTSKSLREVHNDLGPLAREISPNTKPFDTTGTIITTVVQNLGLPYPNEWRASLRTHSFDKGIATKEEVLANDDFALYEYDKCLRAKKYPLFVLSYVGARATEMPKYEIILGLGQVEKEIQIEKAKAIGVQNGPV